MAPFYGARKAHIKGTKDLPPVASREEQFAPRLPQPEAQSGRLWAKSVRIELIYAKFFVRNGLVVSVHSAYTQCDMEQPTRRIRNEISSIRPGYQQVFLPKTKGRNWRSSNAALDIFGGWNANMNNIC